MRLVASASLIIRVGLSVSASYFALVLLSMTVKHSPPTTVRTRPAVDVTTQRAGRACWQS